MTSDKKNIISALALVIFTILLYREWENFDARIFYIELLCFVEVLIQFAYLFFNRKTLSAAEKDREKLVILIYAIAMTGTYLLSLVVVR
ncbi:MAG: hypothetical protein ACOX1L_07790 [Erysipelotrichaceae bacterium]